MSSQPPKKRTISRRSLVGGAAAGATFPLIARGSRRTREVRPVLVGSANALAGMRKTWAGFVAGGEPLDAALETVKVVEADPTDRSVGLGGLPNEDGKVTLDSACMHGPTHNSGAVAHIENILHPCEVARLVMERTDHCLLVGEGAYRFARMHGHPHQDLLTESSRRTWLRWKEGLSDQDDYLPPAEGVSESGSQKSGALERPGDAPKVASVDDVPTRWERHGTIHCSALSTAGEIACTTTTSGLSFKIPGRVGDSPIIGAGLYCDQEAGSAGATGRGEAAILANGSFAIVELMRQGAAPLDAGLEVLTRIRRQVQRQAAWQPALLDDKGLPAFGLKFYILGLDGRWAGVSLRGGGKFAVADPDGGPRLEDLAVLS